MTFVRLNVVKSCGKEAIFPLCWSLCNYLEAKLAHETKLISDTPVTHDLAIR